VAAPLLSIVIPAHNRARLLSRTLETLTDQTLPAELYEILVADDGSTDGTAAMVQAWSARDPRVRLLHSAVNRGGSTARNEGIRHARGEIVVFVDSDVFVRPDFLAQHLDLHRRAPAPVVGRGPVVLVPDLRFPRRTRRTLSPAYLDTANASVPRGELLAAGLFDERFNPWGWGDFDLGFRLRRRGLRRAFRRAAVAYHVQIPTATDTFAEALRKEEARGRNAVSLYRKHPGWGTRVLIQYTFFHRILYYLMAGGGLLNAENVLPLAARLRRRGWHDAANLLLRGVLNRRYWETLHQEWWRPAWRDGEVAGSTPSAAPGR
jgi:glycosyltransferase involved in cell wall biosynthesis